MRLHHRHFALVIAAIMAVTSALTPADVRAKKRSQYPRYQTETPSLDGRITGRTRTCGYDTLQYDGYGVPYGPYCH